MSLFIFGLASAWLTRNVLKPVRQSSYWALVSFMLGWVWGELALHLIALQALLALLLIWGGALDGLAGKLGLLILAGSWAIAARDYRLAEQAGPACSEALAGGLGQDWLGSLDESAASKLETEVRWNAIARPFSFSRPGVAKTTNIVFGREKGIDLKLDVYRPDSEAGNRPLLLQIHGGGWIIGDKREQALPLMHQMASHGWVCATMNYRLSPGATFPEHLVDVKRALAFLREHADDYGIDPGFVVVTGGSAGGHLTALMGLTAGDPEYQPGFESADTSVTAAIPFYGVYDFKNRHGYWPGQGMGELLEEKIMKASIEEDPAAYEKASPMDRVGPDAPPFFIIHGELDSLVPAEEARKFTELMRQASSSEVVYAEIPGAQHAFEIFHSRRSQAVVDAAEGFAQWAHCRYQASKKTKPELVEVKTG